MRLSYKYDIHLACKKIFEHELNKVGIAHSFIGIGEVDIKSILDTEQYAQLKARLSKYGITIIDNQKDSLIQKIKDTIVEMIYLEEKLPNAKTSAYIAEKLNFSYGYLSNLFSEETLSTIESFIILQKIERAKELLINEEHTLTEIAYKLNYSSVAHLSNQFKKTTGLSPSAFQRIISKRKQIKQSSF